MHRQNTKKIISIMMAIVLLLSLQIPVSAEPSEAPYALSGDGIYVEVDGSMSMTVYRVEADGSKTAMTQKPEPITPDIFSAAGNAAWAGKLPWSVSTGTGNTDFAAGSAKLLSDKSGYVTTGTRTLGTAGNEVAVDDFTAETSDLEQDVTTHFGTGDRLTVTGKSASTNLTRILVIETSYDDPGVISVTSQYRNDGTADLDIARFVENNYKIYDPLPAGDYIAKKREAGLFAQQEAGIMWGQEDVTPVYDTMGTRPTTNPVTASKCVNNDMFSRNNWFWDRSSGTALNDFYGTNVGIAIGSAMPYLVRFMELPVRGSGILGQHDTAYTWIGWPGQTIAAGETANAGTSFVSVHTGDYFNADRQYAKAMGWISGLDNINDHEVSCDWYALQDASTLPDRAYEPNWETWGMGESWDPLYMYQQMDELKELGIKSVELDAGWYPRNDAALGEGLYLPATSKWSRFAAAMGMPCTTTEEAKAVVRKFTDIFHENGFYIDAWCMPSLLQSANTTWATNPVVQKFPLIALSTVAANLDPVTGEVLPGSPTPTLARCGGYYPQGRAYDICMGSTQTLTTFLDYFCDLIFDEYGFDGLKIDSIWGTNVCNITGHGHDGNPNASIENWGVFYKKLYDKAVEIKGKDVVMIKNCECGTPMNYYNFSGTNRPIMGDHLGARQMRYMNKKYKGFYGDYFPVDGDHLELSEAVYNNLVDGIDFKSYVGVGSMLDTKYITRKFNSGVPTAEGVAYMTYPGDANYGNTRANWGDYKRFFDISADEGVVRSRYIGDLYKYGFDYPEAYALENEETNTLYYSFFTTNYTVGAGNGQPSNSYKATGGLKDRVMATAAELLYTGNVELRGLEPGASYSVTEYAVTNYTKDDLLNPKPDKPMGSFRADADGVVTMNVNFNRALLLRVTKDIEVESVKIDGAAIQQVRMRSTKQFTATVNPGDATYPSVTWESSNPKIFTVKDGLVTGLSTGNAKLIVTASNGKTSFIMVQVTA